jgi:hypothetical protein
MQTMNISSTMRPTYAAQARPVQGGQQEEQQPPADQFSFASGVAQGGKFVSGIAGPIAGIRWGFKAGMELSIALGQYEVGVAALAGAAIGGFAGNFVGQNAPHLVGSVAEKLGASPEVGQAIGSAAVGTVLGGAAIGLYGAGAGAAIAVGNGAVQHFRG